MIIYIPVKDLVPELSESPELVSMLRQVGIDYATNTIDAVLNDTMMSIFYFSDYSSFKIHLLCNHSMIAI